MGNIGKACASGLENDASNVKLKLVLEMNTVMYEKKRVKDSFFGFTILVLRSHRAKKSSLEFKNFTQNNNTN